jgi:hypothetical protein
MVQNAGQTQAKMYQLGHQKGTYVIDVYACDFRSKRSVVDADVHVRFVLFVICALISEYKCQGVDSCSDFGI